MIRVHVFLTMSLIFLEFSRDALCSEHSLRSNRRSIFCVVAASPVCYCCAFAFVLPRKYHAIGRVHRQLHIDRILQNRQFRSATYITATQICQPERKTVDSRVTLDVFCSVFAIGFAITRYPASRYSSQRHIDWRIAKKFVFYRFFINGFKY